MLQIDNRKIYKLSEITDKNGISKINESELYQEIIGAKVRNLLLEEISDGEHQSALRMEMKTRHGKIFDFQTSLVCGITEEAEGLTVTTHNSIYRFEETGDFSDELKNPPAARKGCIELYLRSVGDRFCQGYYYNAQGKAIELECVVHSGMMADSCLIVTKGEECEETIVCRYFPRCSGTIQFYNNIYNEQRQSLPILIHNEGSEPLFIKFQRSSAKIEIEPGKEKTLLPFAAEEKQEFYKMYLEDCSCPSFCSACKSVFGTLAEIEDFVAAYGEDCREKGELPEIVTAFEKWKAGEKDATHIAACSEQRLLTSAKLVYRARHAFKLYQWEHRNIWGCIYHMRCSAVNTEHRWIECEGRYYRCVTASFEDLEWAEEGEWCKVDDSTWGIPHMLCFEKNCVRNRLAEVENMFETKEEMENDYQKFFEKPIPDFSEFCNEIFGDG